MDNETLAVRAALKAQVADIGRALGITARPGAPASCVTTHALGVCAEKRVAADTGGPDAAPYSLANLQDPSAPPTIAKLVTLASDIPGVDPAKPVEAVLFSSTMDLHGTGSQEDSARAGAAVSFLLLQDGVELEVSGLAQPVQLTLPVRDGAELQRSCVGQPDEATLLERMMGGAPACESTLECRYWDEEEHFWSTEGCRTVVYAENEGGGLAGSGGQPSCECTHLSDFVAVKVPTNAFGDIRFGTINAASLVTTNIDCTEGGVWLTLYKDNASAPEVRSDVRIAYTEGDEVPTSWAVLNLTCRVAAAAPFTAEACTWLEAEAEYGNLTDHVALLARASGLPESMEVDRFVARLALALLYDGGHTRDVIVDVHAAIYPNPNPIPNPNPNSITIPIPNPNPNPRCMRPSTRPRSRSAACSAPCPQGDAATTRPTHTPAAAAAAAAAAAVAAAAVTAAAAAGRPRGG